MPIKPLITVFATTAMAITCSAWAETQKPSVGTQKPMFEHVDTNGDGAISLEEFKDRRDARFGEFDADASGDLSPDEFGVAMEGTPAQRFRGMAFRRADNDGNKMISESEWVGMPVPAFDRLDANGDGKLDTSEFPPQ